MPAQVMAPPPPIRIGVSACLLGEAVRWNGGHKRNPYLTDTLGRVFSFVALCPEVAIGLGVPRPPLRLEGDPAHPQVRGVQERGLEPGAQLAAYAAEQASTLAGVSGRVSGYVFKQGSPSCGLRHVPVYSPTGGPPARVSTGGPPARDSTGGPPARDGTGVYARALMVALPLLPVEEEGRLSDLDWRDNFLERVFAYRRWQALLDVGLTPARLAAFHARHTLALMAHGAAPSKRLGRLLAEGAGLPLHRLAQDYGAAFMALLRRPTTRRRHAAVLRCAMGYLKHPVAAATGGTIASEAAGETELEAALEAYRSGRLPLATPLALLRSQLRRQPHPDLVEQTYLFSTEAEQTLRARGG